MMFFETEPQIVQIAKLTPVLDALQLLLLVIVCLLIGVGLTATVLVTRAYLSAVADELDLILLSHRAWRRFLMGIINGPVLLIIITILSKLPGPLRLLSLALLFLLILLTILGLVAEMAVLGRRVLALRHRDCSLFIQTITGGLVILAVFLLPFIGQAFLLAILFQSLGTSLYWLFKRSKLPRQQPQSTTGAPRGGIDIAPM
ncbi:MAG: hypothetical protein AB1489_31760 [Acidobacteriota bacterium]